MDFIVFRDEWVRGLKGGDSKLLNDRGNMCCLGQCERQLGISKQKLLECSSPEDLQIRTKIFTKINRFDSIEDTVLSKKAMGINDNEDSSDKERERKLQVLFRKFHHTISFVGEYVDGERL